MTHRPVTAIAALAATTLLAAAAADASERTFTYRGTYEGRSSARSHDRGASPSRDHGDRGDRGTRRGHGDYRGYTRDYGGHYRGSRGGHYGHYGHYRSQPRFSLHLGYDHYTPRYLYYGSYRPAYYYYPYVVSAPVVDSYELRRGDYGRVETDVKPSSATVYLDGDPVGIADDFDGWPGRLDVRSGTHELVFREPGYQPLRLTVEVLPYHSVRVVERMQPGADEDFAYAAPPDERPPRTSAERPRPSARDSAALRLRVEPADAAVFVDGQPAEQRGGEMSLDLAPGSHRIEVTKPGYQSFDGEVVLRPGQGQDLGVRLRPEGD